MALQDYLPPEGFDIRPIAFLISLSSVIWTLLLNSQMTRTAASRILDQAERLGKQYDEKLKTMLAADRSASEATMLSYVVTTMIGFVLGSLCGSVDGIELPILTILDACAMFFFLPRPWRMWMYRRLYSTLIKTCHPRADFMDDIWNPMTRCLNKVSPGVRNDILEERADRKKTLEEANDEEDEDVEIVEDEMDDTDDSWSFDLDTPSESENSLPSGTSTSTHSVQTGRVKSSVKKTADAPSRSENARSCLDAFILLATAQDPREPHSRLQTRPDWFMRNRSSTELPEPSSKTTPQPDTLNPNRQSAVCNCLCQQYIRAISDRFQTQSNGQ